MPGGVCWMNFIVRYDTGMHRLTLILSDLYLPAESVRETLPDTMSMPSLSWFALAQVAVKIRS